MPITLEQASVNAMALITNMEAGTSDLAFIFLMSEFIDEVGQEKFKRRLKEFERKWQIAQGEYARGNV